MAGVHHVAISGNRALTSIRGLANLTGGSLSVIGNASLTSLGGLENFREAETLFLSGLGITSMSGLENLRRADSFYLIANPLLTNLRALSAIEGVGTFTVRDNATLPTCEAELLLYEIGIGNVERTIDISGNDGAGVCP